MTKKNILAGWAKAGLFPFHPDRVLRDITKPVADLPIHTACENRGPCQQDEVVQTPVTPASSEGLTSLLNLIKQDPHNEMNQARYQRLANAAQTSFAQQALDQDQIQFLAEMNNEAKGRRKTKSHILGNARVMSFEDIEAARAKRVEQDVAKEAKGKRKRGRPKSVVPEAEATVDKGKRKKRKSAMLEEATMVQTSGTHSVEEESAPQPWRAPVAWMW